MASPLKTGLFPPDWFKDWTRDPEKILRIALVHADLDPNFIPIMLRMVAQWAHENPQARDQLRELLKAERAGRPQLSAAELAATLYQYNQGIEAGQTHTESVSALTDVFSISPKAAESRIKKARKLLDDGGLDQFATRTLYTEHLYYTHYPRAARNAPLPGLVHGYQGNAGVGCKGMPRCGR